MICMITLGLKYLKKLSFPDFEVIGIQFKPEKKYLQIEVNGAWIEHGESQGKELGSGKLRFQSLD